MHKEELLVLAPAGLAVLLALPSRGSGGGSESRAFEDDPADIAASIVELEGAAGRFSRTAGGECRRDSPGA